jgi:hypothetical protein
MISVSIHGLTVTGSNEKEFAFAIKQAQAVSDLAKALGAQAVPVLSVARQGETRPDDYCAQWLASPLNKGKAPDWKPQTRYRMTTAEIADLGEGEEARQASAKARMIAGGLITGSGEAVQGATSADVSADTTLAGQFD